ncbi:hypothetical protein BGZ57DRAFT_969438 [Hyaloscypha finlandica]|nr:hypothetical protein BGZ57DRAFT_969438 [Hyaloscypha finlandica]
MASIYENSYCTIAAAAAENSLRGCYATRNPLSYATCKIGGTAQKGIYVHPSMSRPGGSLDEMEATSTLFTHAWIFQERLLSPRLLYFGKKGICWSCKLGHAYEGDPDGTMFPRDPGSPFDEGGMWRNPVSSFKWLLQNSVSGSKVEDILHYLWFDIVYEYSSSAMTTPKDKLIALSGIAQRIKDCTREEYLAGHWKCTLIPDLLWHVSGPRSARPSEFRAPSWSWASVDGTIASDDPGSVDDLKMSSMATRIDAKVSTQPADTHKTGQILGAYLKFTGRIKRAPRFGNPASGFYSDIEDVVNGPRTIGKVYIDAVTPVMSDVYFMPLRKTEEKGRSHPRERKLVPTPNPRIGFIFRGQRFQALWHVFSRMHTWRRIAIL